MPMKKALGIIMILFGILVAAGTIQTTFKFFTLPKTTNYEAGYAVGYLFAQLLSAAVAFVLIRYGWKIQKNSPKKPIKKAK